MVTILDTRQPRHPEKAHKPDTRGFAQARLIRVQVPAASPQFAQTRADPARARAAHGVRGGRLAPILAECWAGRHATMMIMGDTCTRACAFCNVRDRAAAARSIAHEPEHVAQAVAKLGLAHIVITSVDRDDLRRRRRAGTSPAPSAPSARARRRPRSRC